MKRQKIEWISSRIHEGETDSSLLYGGEIIEINRDFAVIDLFSKTKRLGYLSKDEIANEPVQNIRDYYGIGDFTSFRVIGTRGDGSVDVSVKRFRPEPDRLKKFAAEGVNAVKCAECGDYLIESTGVYTDEKTGVAVRMFPIMRCDNQLCGREIFDDSDIAKIMPLAKAHAESTGETNAQFYHLISDTRVTVRELLRKVGAAEMSAYRESIDDYVDGFLTGWIQFRGICNDHLVMPEDSEFDSDHFSKRSGENTLNGDETVYGDYLLYDVSGHDGRYVIFAHENLEKLERSVLDSGGYTNPFTTALIAVIKGEIRPFELRGALSDGTEVSFAKRENEQQFELCEFVELVWKDEK